MSLTNQQCLYAKGRFAGLNKKDAALAAGCPEKTASQAGSRLEKHPNVIMHLARLKENESETVPGAGRDPLPRNVDPSRLTFDDPMELLKAQMNNHMLDPKVRIQAATALLPYTHQKMGDSGKKENSENDARQVANGGRYQPIAPPQLRLIK